MQLEREWLVSTLRGSGAEKTAQQAEQLLPLEIDVDRDRLLLKRCGIDPNVLASLVEQESEQAAGPN